MKMNEQSIFHCTGYLSISPSCSGLLYPVFRLGNLNASFVQEVDEYGIIQAFVEFWDVDKFRFIASHKAPAVSVGDQSVYAFLNRADVLFEVSFSTFGRAVRTGEFLVDAGQFTNLTRLGIARLTSSNWDEVSSCLDRYLQSKSLSSKSRDTIKKANLSANIHQSSWWKQIGQLEYGSARLAREFKSKNIEDIFAWLFKNVVDDEWRRVFLVIMKRVVTDFRVTDLILKFLGENPSFENYDRIDKIIVGRALEVYIFADVTDVDFSDIMFDSIVTGDFFHLEGPVSANTMFKYISTLIRDREPQGDLENIIDSLIDYLLSDNLSKNLADGILRIVMGSSLLHGTYSGRSAFEGDTRLVRLWEGYTTHSRLQSAMSSALTSDFQSLVLESGILDEEEQAKIYNS